MLGRGWGGVLEQSRDRGRDRDMSRDKDKQGQEHGRDKGTCQVISSLALWLLDPKIFLAGPAECAQRLESAGPPEGGDTACWTQITIPHNSQNSQPPISP